MSRPVLYAGGPCSCSPNRYVRFVIPHVPGLKYSIVSCRAYDSEFPVVMEHEIPPGADVAIRTPSPVDDVNEVFS